MIENLNLFLRGIRQTQELTRENKFIYTHLLAGSLFFFLLTSLKATVIRIKYKIYFSNYTIFKLLIE